MLLLFAYYFLMSGTALEGFIIQSFSQLFSLDLMMVGERPGITTLSSNDANGAAFENEIG